MTDWAAAISAWKDFVVPGPHDRRVEWEYCDEGLDGEYDPSDPEDRPVLRATVWRGMEDESSLSYSTLASPAAPHPHLIELAEDLLSRLPTPGTSSGRKAMEVWTWTTADPSPKEPSDD